MNYFNSNAITCLDDNSYVKNYCFLHGTSHIPAALQSKLSPDGSRCTAENYLKEPEKGERTTNYYIWLPFVLTICAIITKLPSLFWKNFFESGHMEKITNDCQAEKSDGAKIKKVLMESSLQKSHALWLLVPRLVASTWTTPSACSPTTCSTSTTSSSSGGGGSPSWLSPPWGSCTGWPSSPSPASAGSGWSWPSTNCP